MSKMMRVTVLIVLAASLGLSACGRKQALTPPDGSTYPKQYPRE